MKRERHFKALAMALEHYATTGNLEASIALAASHYSEYETAEGSKYFSDAVTTIIESWYQSMD